MKYHLKTMEYILKACYKMTLMLLTISSSSFVITQALPRVAPMDKESLKSYQAAFKGSKENLVLVGPEKYVLSERYQTQGSRYYNYRPQPTTDVFLTSFTGFSSIWFAEAIWMICNNLDNKTSTHEPLENRVVWLEESMMVNKDIKRSPVYSGLKLIRTYFPLSLIPTIATSAKMLLIIQKITCYLLLLLLQQIKLCILRIGLT